MELSFTGIVYIPITFGLLFIAFRFFRDWRLLADRESLVYFFVFLLFGLVCLSGALAGTVYAHSPAGIRWMLILSSYLLAVTNGMLGYLFFLYRFPKKSPWIGFLPIFVFGIFVSIFTTSANVQPNLEPSGGIYWGMPFYISFLRFLLYFIGVVPLLYVLLTQKVKNAADRDSKIKYLSFVAFFVFVLIVVIVDFLLEPLFKTKALFSELAILFVIVVFTAIYFYFMERVIGRSERRFRRLVENMSDMISLIDENGIIDYANPAQSKSLGYHWREIIGKAFLNFVHREDKERVKEFIFGTDESKRKERIEFRILQKSGEIKWVETAGFFFLDSNTGADHVGKLVLASRDVTDRKIAVENLNKSLQEKKILISEIYHRVRNNLATVIGLLTIHASMLKDERAKSVLLDTKNRIFSMSLVHQLLYQTKDLSDVNFKEYVERLVNNLSKASRHSDKIKIHYDLAEIMLNIEVAVPCGLIIHELVTNSFRHAFSENNSGNIFIETKKIGGNSYQMIIRDDGVGFNPKVLDEPERSLGFKLVKSLVAQIEGELEIKADNGTEIIVSCKNR